MANKYKYQEELENICNGIADSVIEADDATMAEEIADDDGVGPEQIRHIILNAATIAHSTRQELPSNIFTCLGRPYHLDDLYQLQPVDWTISKNASPGDTAVFYLTAPISAVVGFGKVIKKPWYEEESDWQEKHFSRIDEIVMFDENRFITNRELRAIFPEWRYLWQPRASVAAPPGIITPFWELLQEKV